MDESMRKLPTPTKREYIEVTETNVEDRGDTVLFKFRFARPVSDTEIHRLWSNTDGAVNKIVQNKLREKGWVSSDGKEELVPMSSDGQASPDEKTWTLYFHREAEDSDMPPTVH